ncbi:CHAT domain-containing protein [Parafrankia elaeagni]|uniref:CHAT domain-containing protein n=1 Tax=Parafrankia elaeagni TaxID=222534 RepID=UPI00037297C9|nr:CHAT domain-containing protein [Parafrankia elaeagni]
MTEPIVLDPAVAREVVELVRAAGGPFADTGMMHMRSGPVLLDEAIHLAAAFQPAGYRHVVGTLWSVSDAVSVSIADAVYTAVESTRGDVALAVHTAVRAARSRGIESSWWAAYIHNGG